MKCTLPGDTNATQKDETVKITQAVQKDCQPDAQTQPG